jgi:beta-galactosidase
VADDAVRLELEVSPDGPWPDLPLPRLGVRLTVPARFDQTEWFGPGPHETYPDVRLSALVGRYAMPVDRMQTPYTHPQENGHRIDVRTATLTDPLTRATITFDGEPSVGLTVRRWTSEDLDAAAHPIDLTPRDRTYVNLDRAHHGIGTGSCGPGTLDAYHLSPTSATFAVVLRTSAASGATA